MKSARETRRFRHIIIIPIIFLFSLCLILIVPYMVNAQAPLMVSGPLTWGLSGPFLPNGVFPAEVIDMKTDTQGNLHILGYYGSSSDHNDRLHYVQRTQAGVWLATQRIDQEGQFIRNPHMAIDGGGNVHVIWTEDVDASEWVIEEQVMYNKRTVGGNWGTPQIISDELAGYDQIRASHGIALATNQPGDVIVSWVALLSIGQNIYNYALVSRFKPAAGNWSGYELANTSYTESAAYGPEMKMDNNGNTQLLWMIFPSAPTNPGVYINTHTYGASWGTSHLVTVNGQPVYYFYRMEIANNGQVYALLSIGWSVWTTYIGNGAFQVISNLPATPPEANSCSDIDLFMNSRGDALVVISCLVFPDKIYYSYAPYGGGWSPYTQVSHQTEYIEETDPIVALTDTGLAYIVWLDNISSNNNQQVFAMSQMALATANKRVDAPVAIPGETSRYTITLKNPMPFSLPFTVSDPLPSGTTYVPGSVTVTTGNVTPSSTQINWTGSIPINGTARVSFSVLVDEPITSTVFFLNEATASATPDDVVILRAYMFANPRQTFLPMARR